MEANGLSDGRVYKVLSTTKLVAEKLDGKSLVDATEDDIKDIVAWVEKRDISEWTKTDYRRMVKRFYKWENGGEYLDKVEWVNTTYRGNNEKLPENLPEYGFRQLSVDELEKLFEDLPSSSEIETREL
ncbi:hypothetical protein AKJ64_03735 [candidate division MSBL1 archaeon SCGC-AAA259E17]|uniref:Core-binding (CB) domain-containing protein n=1 Tax=candidate division MSBL1 archaeon SCGC-AAA259E17 TaxID=1698263 RepID=A0A133UDN0_9EURY|nr:hypothetical protein AKJ64_03735 [candidate division MSBL1 archaeon SCGC-AAA259E17]